MGGVSGFMSVAFVKTGDVSGIRSSLFSDPGELTGPGEEETAKLFSSGIPFSVNPSIIASNSSSGISWAFVEGGTGSNHDSNLAGTLGSNEERLLDGWRDEEGSLDAGMFPPTGRA